MSWFWSGGGGGNDDSWKKEYEARMAERRRFIEEQRKGLRAEQAAIDAIQDEQQRKEANRKRYKCRDRFVEVPQLPVWTENIKELVALPEHSTVAGKPRRGGSMMWASKNDEVSFKPEDLMRQKDVNEELNKKISIFQGDICCLEVDGIVNAANSSLLGGGGIDGAIHSAAGELLGAECETLNGAETGETKMTRGYNLPAKHVLHTVGPIGGGDDELKSCYSSCMDLVDKNGLKTVAFCCVSTGVFGFPLVRATHIALRIIREWLESGDNANKVDRIIFCVFRDVELETYEKLLPVYFPTGGFPEAVLPPDVKVPGPESPKKSYSYGGMGGGGMGGGGMGGGGRMGGAHGGW